jgi:hypothetical protein
LDQNLARVGTEVAPALARRTAKRLESGAAPPDS